MGTIIFKPTYRCNLKCTYCYEAKNRDADNPISMTQEQAVIALENLINIHPEESWDIIWHGGEPTILGLDYFKNVINHFNDYNNISWGLQSNGTLITEDWFDFLREKGISIGSSWDGFDNNLTRDSRNFLDLAFKAQKAGVSIGAIFTMTPENSTHALETYKFAQDKKIPIIFNTAFGINLTKEDHILLGRRMAEIFDYICICENVNIERPFDEILSYIEGRNLYFCEGKNCVGDWYGIHPNGDIFSCGKPWGNETCLGNVFTDADHLKETLKNAPFRKILLDARQQQLEDCKECKYVMLCRGKCPFTGFKGLTYSKDFNQCAYTKTFYDESLKNLHKHLEHKTLINRSIISKISTSNKMEFIRWKFYKSPLIMN